MEERNDYAELHEAMIKLFKKNKTEPKDAIGACTAFVFKSFWNAGLPPKDVKEYFESLSVHYSKSWNGISESE